MNQNVMSGPPPKRISSFAKSRENAMQLVTQKYGDSMIRSIADDSLINSKPHRKSSSNHLEQKVVVNPQSSELYSSDSCKGEEGGDATIAPAILLDATCASPSLSVTKVSRQRRRVKTKRHSRRHSSSNDEDPDSSPTLTHLSSPKHSHSKHSKTQPNNNSNGSNGIGNHDTQNCDTIDEIWLDMSDVKNMLNDIDIAKTQNNTILNNSSKYDIVIKESSSTGVVQGLSSPSDRGSGVYPLPITNDHTIRNPTLSPSVKFHSVSPASRDPSSSTIAQTPISRKLSGQLAWPHIGSSPVSLDVVESNMLDLSTNVARKWGGDGEGRLGLKQDNRTVLDTLTEEKRRDGRTSPLLSKSQLLSMTPVRQGVTSPVVATSSFPSSSITPEKQGMSHALPRTNTGAPVIKSMFGAAVAASGQKRVEELLKRREVEHLKFVTVSNPRVHDVALVVAEALDMGEVADDTTITRLVDHIDCDDDRLQDDNLQYEAVMNSDVTDSYSGPLVALGDTVSWGVQRSTYSKTLSRVATNHAMSFSVSSKGLEGKITPSMSSVNSKLLKDESMHIHPITFSPDASMALSQVTSTLQWYAKREIETVTSPVNYRSRQSTPRRLSVSNDEDIEHDIALLSEPNPDFIALGSEIDSWGVTGEEDDSAAAPAAFKWRSKSLKSSESGKARHRLEEQRKVVFSMLMNT